MVTYSMSSVTIQVIRGINPIHFVFAVDCVRWIGDFVMSKVNFSVIQVLKRQNLRNVFYIKNSEKKHNVCIYIYFIVLRKLDRVLETRSLE